MVDAGVFPRRRGPYEHRGGPNGRPEPCPGFMAGSRRRLWGCDGRSLRGHRRTLPDGWCLLRRGSLECRPSTAAERVGPAGPDMTRSSRAIMNHTMNVFGLRRPHAGKRPPVEQKFHLPAPSGRGVLPACHIDRLALLWAPSEPKE